MTRPIASSNLTGSWTHVYRSSGEGLDDCMLMMKLKICMLDCQTLLARSTRVFNSETTSLDRFSSLMMTSYHQKTYPVIRLYNFVKMELLLRASDPFA